MADRLRNIAACGPGIWATRIVSVLIVSYLAVLGGGLLSLPSSAEAIGDPWYAIMEVLILLLMPALLMFAVAIRECATANGKLPGACAVIFFSALTILTMTVHFLLLTVSREPLIVASAWWSRAFAFEWPSLVYALDILAWDVFFPLGMAFGAFAVDGTPQARWLKLSMLASGAVALAGLAGAFTGNMLIRDIAIPGYTLFLLPVTHFARQHFRGLQKDDG